VKTKDFAPFMHILIQEIVLAYNHGGQTGVKLGHKAFKYLIQDIFAKLLLDPQTSKKINLLCTQS
jgi:hypothetical protein